MADGVVAERYEGTPQGGPLSPLLANVLLDAIAARYGRSWWRVARWKALNIGLPGAYFESLGVPRLASLLTSTH